MKSWGDAFVCDPWMRDNFAVKDMIGKDHDGAQTCGSYQHIKCALAENPEQLRVSEAYTIGGGHSERWQSKKRPDLIFSPFKLHSQKEHLEQKTQLSSPSCAYHSCTRGRSRSRDRIQSRAIAG